MDRVRTVIVGAGAAGLMAAIRTGRARPGESLVVLDGARSLGAKILVAGGGRCNVTHEAVSETDFSGSTPAAIRKVLRRFSVADTIAFFDSLGVELVREETGKLFPSTNRARTVLDALLRAAREAGAQVRFPRRVERITPAADGLVVSGDWGELIASTVVLATGGRSLPKSGSDGHGLAMARSLGHSIVPTLPALVPLVLSDASPLRRIPGVAANAELRVLGATGRTLATCRGAVLCTHFGVSGPGALDISRHWLVARREDAGVTLAVNWLPGETTESVDRALLASRATRAGRFLARLVPESLAHAICGAAGVDPAAIASDLRRELRRGLAREATAMTLPVSGDRGWNFAEVTAGGVPLSEVRLETMESRLVPGLRLVGEILDVDGRIGGFNFQWAWASGHVAGAA